MAPERSTHTAPDGLPYLLFRPSVPPAGSGGPLIVFLHGRDEHGNSERTLEKVTGHSLPKLAAEGSLPKVGGGVFPFAVACPQTAGPNWRGDAARVPALVEHLLEGDLGVDRERVYVTGISAGGGGCWRAVAAGSVFAALIPVSAGIPKREARDVKAPAWVIVGAADKRAPKAAKVEADLYSIRPRDERTKFWSVPGAGHTRGFWNRLYARSDLYEWLLDQRWSG